MSKRKDNSIGKYSFLQTKSPSPQPPPLPLSSPPESPLDSPPLVKKISKLIDKSDLSLVVNPRRDNPIILYQDTSSDSDNNEYNNNNNNKSRSRSTSSNIFN
jgi:hypothetical protein